MAVSLLGIMSLLRRRCTWLYYRLAGRHTLIVLLLTILAIIFLLFHHEGRSGSSGDTDIAVGDMEAAADAKPLPGLTAALSSTPIPVNKLAIPKRIHHFFDDAVDIPKQQAQAVNSWANNHKNYNAYFWDSRYLKSRLLPGLSLYEENTRCFQVEQHSVSRLLLLFNKGGVLADPDLTSLRNLDSFLDGSNCVMAQESPEVAVLLYGIQNRSLPSLRFVACRPGHPFMRLLLKNFCRCTLELRRGGAQSKSQRMTALALADSFEAAVSAYDDLCMRRVCDHRDRIVLADAGVFLPLTPTGGLRSRLAAACNDVSAAGGGSEAEQLACRRLQNPLQEGGTRLSSASLAMPMRLSDQEVAGERIPLDRIGPNVGRAVVLNLLLPTVSDAVGRKIHA